jgi:hypothetical protein
MSNRTTPQAESHATQMKIYFEYLKINVASNSMVTDATGIPQKCLTRYKREFEKQNLLRQLYRKRCKITGRFVWYLTTNQNLIKI